MLATLVVVITPSKLFSLKLVVQHNLHERRLFNTAVLPQIDNDLREEVPPPSAVSINSKSLRSGCEGWKDFTKSILKLDLGCPKERCAYDCHTH